MSGTSWRSRGRSRAAGIVEHVGIVLVCYLPFLASSPGRIGSDSKQYLYLDPAAFLGRALHLWDAQAGAGTVGHQYLGYLWPMGPWFAVMDALGVPVWVAQRLWLGTLSLAAVLGARWLLRTLGLGRAGALAGAFVYLLTPYQLAFTARMSVLLLPWAGLPWLLGFTHRALRRGGWRDPALFALVVLCIGAVNASSLVLVGIGPLVWCVVHALRGGGPGRAVAAAGRLAVLSLGVSLWWITGLWVAARYGIPVLHVTENLETVAASSDPLDVLRGIGNWFFYGRDRLGYSIDQAGPYATHWPTITATLLVPAGALAAAVALRWRHREVAIALVVVGTIVAVGAWPIGGSSPYGGLWERLSDTAAGLALRNSPRAVPVVVAGMALLVGAAVAAGRTPGRRAAGAVVVTGVAALGLWPAWQTGFLSDNLDRDRVPGYWREVAADLDAEGSAHRVLEIPGSPFAAHRWGNAIDPVLPGLMRRPALVREVFPQGSVESALLLDALDRRIQEGTFEPGSLAPVARLFGADTVLLRSDLQYERFRTPNPRALWAQLTDRLPEGLEEPVGYGRPTPNVPVADLPMLDETELALPAGADHPPPLARIPVEDPLPIVRAAPVERPVLLAGDGDGVVDAAAAGLLDGRALVRFVAGLGDAELAEVLAADADLVLTDSNRRRSQIWFFAIRDTRGPTEQEGETLPEPSGYDVRLEPFPGTGDDSRSVVEQIGGSVDATGASGAARPEDRPARAADGDVGTSWRVGGADPTGHRLEIELDAERSLDRLHLVQPLDGARDRMLTEVRVTLDGRPPIDVQLGPDSFTPEGQLVEIPPGEVRRVELELTGVSEPPFDPALANAVGFAEVRLGDARISETVRLPRDLLGRTDGGDGHQLDVALTRLRYDPLDRGRQDEELVLDRTFELPSGRAFGMTGTLRLNPDVDGALLDEVLGTDLAGARVTTSGHLAGDAGSRGSRALDGDPATAWQPHFGTQEGQSLAVELPEPTELGPLSVEMITDGRHSPPSALRVEADGAFVGTAVFEAAAEGRRTRVDVPTPDGPVRELRLVVEHIQRRTPVENDPNPADVLPVAIAEIQGAGLPRARDPETIPEQCLPLLEVDGAPIEVRLEGRLDDARRGWELSPCGAETELDLGSGSHRIVSAPGSETGIDVDRVVLSSAPDGSAGAVGVRGADRAGIDTEIEVVDEGRTGFDLDVTTDGEPFWLVLGQSSNDGWQLQVDRAGAGPRQVVDGYANGWLVEPDGAGTFRAELRWTPQRVLWPALAVSALTVAGCVAVVVLGRRRRPGTAVAGIASRHVDDPATAEEPVLLSGPPLAAGVPGARPAIPAAVLAAVTFLVATPAAAVVGAAAVWLGLSVPRTWLLRLLLAPLLVAVARIAGEPALAWVALAVVAADAVVRAVAPRHRDADPPRTVG